MNNQSPPVAHRRELRVAALLGFAALAPLIIGLLLVFVRGHHAAPVLSILSPYVALIVAFICGVQWGRILTHGESAPWTGLSLAVLPALIAWPALLLVTGLRIPVLMVALIVAWVGDERGTREGWQTPTFLQLRRLLTVAVLVMLFALRLAAWF